MSSSAVPNVERELQPARTATHDLDDAIVPYHRTTTVIDVDRHDVARPQTAQPVEREHASALGDRPGGAALQLVGHVDRADVLAVDRPREQVVGLAAALVVFAAAGADPAEIRSVCRVAEAAERA